MSNIYYVCLSTRALNLEYLIYSYQVGDFQIKTLSYLENYEENMNLHSTKSQKGFKKL